MLYSYSLCCIMYDKFKISFPKGKKIKNRLANKRKCVANKISVCVSARIDIVRVHT